MARGNDRKTKLVGRMNAIAALDRRECHLEWREVFGRPPPKYLSIRFMQRVLVHEVQIRSIGAYPTKVRRLLNQFDPGSPRPKTTDVPVGTVFLREWNGRTYRVEAVESGFIMDGKHYRSLSGIAKRITGAHWSGARFFGLHKARARDATDA